MVQLASVPAGGRGGIGQDLARGKPDQVRHAEPQGKCASRRRGPRRHPAPANGTATVKRTAPIAFGYCKPGSVHTRQCRGAHRRGCLLLDHQSRPRLLEVSNLEEAVLTLTMTNIRT